MSTGGGQNEIMAAINVPGMSKKHKIYKDRKLEHHREIF